MSAEAPLWRLGCPSWPLTDEGKGMDVAELFGELTRTISELNSRDDYPYVIMQPRLQDVSMADGRLTAVTPMADKKDLRR
ncbi:MULTISPECIES: hypothetical protein [Bifidobacterium]|uniref:hypothetical protein n=1 Tax=Bifidobacterium TaxID=1678 RepID=UPI00126A2A3F|nr:hypothetical protein [Bifidobacterium tibiigranuli]